MKERIYTVMNEVTGSVRLVMASNRAQAISHVATSILDCKVASQADLVQHVSEGVEVEQAGVHPDPEPVEIMGEKAHVQPE